MIRAVKALKKNNERKYFHKIQEVNGQRPAMQKQKKTRHIDPPSYDIVSQSLNSFLTVKEHPRIHTIISNIPESTKDILTVISQWEHNPFPSSYYIKYSSHPLQLFWSPEIKHELLNAFMHIQKIRMTLRKFLHMWRSKNLRESNTEDIVTMEIPSHPVTIVDWPSRAKYVFEASTIMRDITSRLLFCSGFFDTAQVPRNPLTNIPLTQSQIISVWSQVELSGIKVSSTFLNFKEAKWNIDHFSNLYELPLLMNAHRTTMHDTSSIDYKEKLLEFIEMAYEERGMECFKTSYYHALNKYPENSLLKSWAILARDYYELDIIYRNMHATCNYKKKIIMDKTRGLLSRQYELRNIFRGDIRTLRNGVQILLYN